MRQSSPPLPVARLRDDAFPADQRFEVWREGTLPLFDVTPLADPADFRCNATAYRLDRLLVTRARFSSQRFMRTRRQLADGASDYLSLQLYLSGAIRGHVGESPLLMAPDRVAFQDFAVPYVGQAEDAEVLGVSIPREWIDEMDWIHDKAPMFSWSVASERGAVLAAAMVGLWSDLPALKADDAPGVAAKLMELINRQIHAGRSAAAAPEPEEPLDLSMRAYLTANLNRSDLDAELLSKRFHCSRAKVFRLFQEQGGVRRFVTDQRLIRCFNELASPAPKSVREIAERWGFSSPAHFSRLFRARFGKTPTAVAESGRAPRRPDNEVAEYDVVQRLQALVRQEGGDPAS